jgi:hypothetical protein
MGGPVDVAPDRSPQVALADMPNPVPREVLGSGPLPEVVLICRDQFGNWFAFEAHRPPRQWRVAGGDAKPNWVEWAEVNDTGPDIPYEAPRAVH